MKQKFGITFHLGLPKVASTFLQKEIFPNLNNISFHRKRKFNEYKNLKEEKLTCSHLFSSEYDRGLEETVDEITGLFPDAKIIFLVRRHDKWILSKYKYYIRKHGSMKFENLIDVDSNNGFWKREELLFKNKIEYIEKRCKTKPLILPHSLLCTNPDSFIQRINQYLGTSLNSKAKKHVIVNKSFNEKQLIFLRKFNQIYKYREIKTSYKLINRIHYKYREFLLHIVGFTGRFLPKSLVQKNPLIKDENILSRIREYYKKDWDFCLEYSKINEGTESKN